MADCNRPRELQLNVLRFLGETSEDNTAGYYRLSAEYSARARAKEGERKIGGYTGIVKKNGERDKKSAWGGGATLVARTARKFFLNNSSAGGAMEFPRRVCVYMAMRS